MPIDHDSAHGQVPAREFIAKVDSAMPAVFRKSVVPLFQFAPEHDYARLLGTATLVAVAGRHFIVTAAHAVADMFKNGNQLDDLYVPNLDGAFVPVEGRFAGARQDEHDFAFVEMGVKTLERLRSRTFLSLADIDLTTGPLPAGWYYVHGYPGTQATSGRSGDEFRAKPSTYGAPLYEGPTSFLRTFDPALHALVEIDPTQLATGADEGTTPSMPSDFKGISGSSMWRAFSFGVDANAWTPSDARVVAVETCVAQKDGRFIVRGTRWFVVLALLRHAFPDLASAIALHDPPPVSARVGWENEPEQT